jgi:3-phosphoshikimate 1-carboxyvinyltransferase
MTGPHAVEPLAGRFDAEIRVPGSKSLTNRALVCAGLARGRSELTGALFADDTEAMMDCLQRLGVTIDADREGARLGVEGCGGVLRPGPLELDARLSGTTARFLLPVLAIGPGPYRLDGAPPLRARPMWDGIAGLMSLGLEVTQEGEQWHLPITVAGRRERGGGIGVPGDVSSQFLSGMLLAAPCWPDQHRIGTQGPLVSRPYIDLTIEVMRAFGGRVDIEGPMTWNVRGGGYRGTGYEVEPDASAAAYFFAAAAICDSRVRVSGLGRGSAQGDLAFVRVLERMGAAVTIDDDATTVEGTGELHGVTADLRDFSDQAQTLAVTAVFAEGPTEITGIGFIRGKETDRIGAVVRELSRCGVRVEERADGMVIHPSTPHGATVETYDDHRMAMSFALLGLRVPGISIADPDCVGKTFPGFFDQLDTLRGGVR